VDLKKLICEKSAEKTFATEMRYSPEASLSDAGIPGIASFWTGGAQTLAESFQIVGDRQVSDEFHVLVAETCTSLIV
jgi:hypothetical protein